MTPDHTLAQVPSPLWTLPFAALLLAIAVFPLGPKRLHHWWEHNASKLAVGLALGLVVLVYYGFRGYGIQVGGHGDATAPGWKTVVMVLEHAILQDFIPFIVLLFSLYVISGGIQLRGDLQARPATNTAFLAVGAFLASFVGTTGASMVLIRPLLQTNRDRAAVKHTVIFFIFLVSNVGGCLLPLGDPPLFLGYLRGVPFLWTTRLVLPWLFSCAVLLAVYYVWDRLAYRRETIAALAGEKRHASPLRLHGVINLVWLLGVVLSVALIVPGTPLPGTEVVVQDFAREAVMIGLAVLSLATTPRGLRKEVEFTYGAILEVACLFLGIFVTMQVPVEILRAKGASLGLTSPSHFFWGTGLLSSVLDNAPTYLVFFETARSMGVPEGTAAVALLGGGTIRQDLLVGISLGAVFMGANTYIGNGPNFMVKSIAEARGVAMPSFFGYMLYSGLILMPLFAAVSLIFFR